MGDRFYLCDNQILCEYDYEERLIFANLATPGCHPPIPAPSNDHPQTINPELEESENSSRQNRQIADDPRPPAVGEKSPALERDSPANPVDNRRPHHDGSSSGYGSPDSGSGLIDEG